MMWLGLDREKIFCLKEPLDTWVECNNMLVNLFLGGCCEEVALWNVDGVATLLISNHSTDYMSCYIMKSQSYQMRAMNAPLFRLTLYLLMSSYHLRNEKLYQGKIFTTNIKSYLTYLVEAGLFIKIIVKLFKTIIMEYFMNAAAL